MHTAALRPLLPGGLKGTASRCIRRFFLGERRWQHASFPRHCLRLESPQWGSIKSSRNSFGKSDWIFRSKGLKNRLFLKSKLGRKPARIGVPPNNPNLWENWWEQVALGFRLVATIWQVTKNSGDLRFFPPGRGSRNCFGGILTSQLQTCSRDDHAGYIRVLRLEGLRGREQG